MEVVLVLCVDPSYLLLHQVPPAQVEVDHDGAGVEPDQDVGADQAHAVGGGGQLQPGQAHLHRVTSEQVLARGGAPCSWWTRSPGPGPWTRTPADPPTQPSPPPPSCVCLQTKV